VGVVDDQTGAPAHDDMPRFSDAELVALREEFEEHRDVQVRNNARQDRRWEQLASMVEQNTEATQAVARSVESIARSTEGVVQLYRDFQGAARVGIGVRKLLAWLIALGTGGAAIAAAIMYFLDKLGIPVDPPG
jgi:hypothetical protein